MSPLLKTCVMCGRNEFEVPGEWFFGRPNGTRMSVVDLCEKDAPNFDPDGSYDPVKAEMILGKGCASCGHQRFVIDTGQDAYQCAKCGAELPPGALSG